MRYDIVPESAPFSPEQRAWLNGFFAGVLGSLDAENTRSGSAVSLAAAAAMLPPLSGFSDQALECAPEEEFPWHDSTLSTADRMALAEGKPIERQMMAAMAQLDCGTCGYLCKTYAEAIATGKEKCLTLCTPGGSDTAKLLRTLFKQREGKASVTDAKVQQPAPPITRENGNRQIGTRESPVQVQFVSSERLNGPQSAKDTRHVRIDLGDSGLRYSVGDALGVLPTNCDQLIDAICQAAKVDPRAAVSVEGTEFLLTDVLKRRCLRSVTPELCERARERLQQRSQSSGEPVEQVQLAQYLVTFTDSDLLDEYDVHEFLLQFGAVGVSAQDLIDTLTPLRPRLYSIASSQCVHDREVHLTVGRVESELRGRVRKGVASTMFAERLEPGARLQVFVQPNHGFTIPADPTVATIMVGPGTGIAPFIAFLQQREFERSKQHNCGENWLFFGDQTRVSDFLYEEQLTAWLETDLLSRLDLAFSRDGCEKVYVQDRMHEQGAELFRWLEAGSHLYVCGDAQRMARDVEQSLLEIIALHGGHSMHAAKDYLKSLRQCRRYATDVY